MIDVEKAMRCAGAIYNALPFDEMRCDDITKDELDEFLNLAVEAVEKANSKPKMTNLEFYLKEAEELQKVRKTIEEVRLNTSIDLCAKCPHSSQCNHSASKIYDSNTCARHLREHFMEEHKEEPSE